MLGFRRVLAALAVSSAIAGLGAAPALASNNPHDRQLQQLPPPFTQPMCGPAIGDVTLSIDPGTFRAATKTFTLQDGTTKIQFNGYARQIVQGNGKTLELNVSGPGTIFIAPDGAFITAIGGGHLFYIGPVGTPQQGLTMYDGHSVLATIDTAAYGTIFVVSSFTGHKTDICALLA
ncbi:MAG: hypothetical protein E6I71_08920 [Chloroflexi bacterium]|nr:MAG: hypothetical protein E6I71_08920 [Chloroflexota bacterium]